jgi:hypothetical protein
MRQAQWELSSTVSQTSVYGEQAEAYFFLCGRGFFLRRNPHAEKKTYTKIPSQRQNAAYHD